MEADSKSHLRTISLSRSVCELCVCVTVCVTHLFPLSLFSTLHAWGHELDKEERVKELSNREHGRADKICYNKVTGSAGNSDEF